MALYDKYANYMFNPSLRAPNVAVNRLAASIPDNLLFSSVFVSFPRKLKIIRDKSVETISKM